MNEKIEVDIKVPNQTRYLGLIGKIGEDIARTLKKYQGDREELAYHLNLVLTEAMANAVITSYSIHYTKLYEACRSGLFADGPRISYSVGSG